MDIKAVELAEAGNLPKALSLAKTSLEKARKSTELNAQLASNLEDVARLLRQLCKDGNIAQCKEIVELVLEVLQVTPPLKMRYYNQLGLVECVMCAMYRYDHSTATQIVKAFDLIYDQRVKGIYLFPLIQKGDYKAVMPWIQQIDDPNFYSVDTLVSDILKHAKVEQALMLIKEYKLYNPQNKKEDKYGIHDLVLKLIKQGGILDALDYITEFELQDKDDFENASCPGLSELNIVLALFQRLHWKKGLQYVQSSRFKNELEQMFTKRKVLVSMIKRKDWVSFAAYLKKEEYIDEIEKPDENNPEILFKETIVAVLLQEQEVVKATKYAIKFELLDKFPLEFLFDKLIRRLEFGALLHFAKKYEYHEELEKFQKALLMNKFFALQDFRRRYRTFPPMQSGIPKKVVVREFEFQKLEAEIQTSKAPATDDEYLVQSNDHYMSFLAESNRSIKTLKESPGRSHQPSPRLQHYVEKRFAQKKNMNAASNQEPEFKINPNAVAWSPPTQHVSLDTQLSSLSIGSGYEQDSRFFQNNQVASQANGERVYDQLKRVVSNNSISGQGNGMSQREDWQRREIADQLALQRMREAQSRRQAQSYDNAGTDFYRQSRSNVMSPGEHNLDPSYSASASRQNLYAQEQDIQRRQQQQRVQAQRMQQLRQQRELQVQQQQQRLAQAQASQYRNLSSVNDLEELNRRERIEKLIQGLLNLNREAQVVRKNLANVASRNQEAQQNQDTVELSIIYEEYQRLKMIKEQHKAKEKRVLMAARTDPDVAEAVAEFQRRRRVLNNSSMSPTGGNQFYQQQQQQQQVGEHHARQLQRLRQHEMEKQRQMQLRMEQERSAQAAYQQRQQQLLQQQRQQQRQRFSPEFVGEPSMSRVNSLGSTRNISSNFNNSPEVSVFEKQNSFEFNNSEPEDFDYFGNFGSGLGKVDQGSSQDLGFFSTESNSRGLAEHESTREHVSPQDSGFNINADNSDFGFSMDVAGESHSLLRSNSIGEVDPNK